MRFSPAAGRGSVTVPAGSGAVYVVATPIGNLEDLSPRALRVLREVSCIACEDTRRTARLCARFEVPTRRVSLHEHNERRRTPELLARLGRGESLALVSDAGTPLVSDPGARFIRAAIEAGHRIVPVPGPSAVLAALVASGLCAGPFTFIGFLPRKGPERRARLAELGHALGTLVLFEAPGRVRATLRELARALGDREVVVARELTKRFEELQRGRLESLELEEPRGEVTLVVEGARARAPDAGDDADMTEEIDRLLALGQSPRDVARELAARTGTPRSRIYARVLERVRDEHEAGNGDR
jgi:16S rRNA (cytidine1402-2'-O)-methyltransferase